mmetsp:Transcript_127332/g.254372  ORF Transcript_127332/g.254372 Transcript_127332/m.254372 type:complete len:111 (-) Transcript_127332:1086-1418(-)
MSRSNKVQQQTLAGRCGQISHTPLKRLFSRHFMHPRLIPHRPSPGWPNCLPEREPLVGVERKHTLQELLEWLRHDISYDEVRVAELPFHQIRTETMLPRVVEALAPTRAC